MVRQAPPSEPEDALLEPDVLENMARVLDAYADARLALDSILTRVVPPHPGSADCRSIIADKAHTDRSIARQMRRLARQGQRLSAEFMLFLEPIAMDAMDDYTALRETIDAGYEPADADDTEPRYDGADMKAALELSAALSFMLVMLSARLLSPHLL